MPLVLPTQTYTPARLRAAIDAWATLALGWTSSGPASSAERRVLEADQNAPRPDLPYLSYQRVGPPAPAIGGHDSVTTAEVITSAAIDVTASAAGEWTVVIINAQRFARQMLGGESPTDQRDALLALITASIEPVTCTASGASTIDLVPQYTAACTSLIAVQGCTLTTIVDTRDIVRGLRTWRYRMQLHAGSEVSDAASGWIDVDQCADLLLTTLYSPTFDATLAALQVSRFGERPIPQRASVPSGGRIEQRVFFDVGFSMVTRLVSATTSIGVETFTPPAIVLND